MRLTGKFIVTFILLGGSALFYVAGGNDRPVNRFGVIADVQYCDCDMRVYDRNGK